MAPLIHSKVTIARKLVLIVGIAVLAVTVWDRTAPAQTVAGGPRVISGGDVEISSSPTIYSVQVAGPVAWDMVSIAVRISGAPDRPLEAADIAAITLYADANANGVLDAADTFMGSQTSVNVGGNTTVTDLSPSEALAPAGVWFFVSITFNGSAIDRFFTVGAPSNNIQADDPPPGLPAPIDGSIGAGAAVRVWQPRDVAPIPVGGEWIAGLAFVGYGVYRLLRRKAAA